jgi:hypothetical protein
MYRRTTLAAGRSSYYHKQFALTTLTLNYVAAFAGFSRAPIMSHAWSLPKADSRLCRAALHGCPSMLVSIAWPDGHAIQLPDLTNCTCRNAPLR